jgi:hypothetical protein
MFHRHWVLIFPLSILFNDQNVKFKTDSDDSAFLVRSPTEALECQRSVDWLFWKRVKRYSATLWNIVIKTWPFIEKIHYWTFANLCICILNLSRVTYSKYHAYETLKLQKHARRICFLPKLKHIANWDCI